MRVGTDRRGGGVDGEFTYPPRIFVRVLPLKHDGADVLRYADSWAFDGDPRSLFPEDTSRQALSTLVEVPSTSRPSVGDMFGGMDPRPNEPRPRPVLSPVFAYPFALCFRSHL